MNRFPPVSIFIVTRLNSADRGSILLRTCECALAQNYPDFEVIVSENPGTHSAREALASIRDPRLKIFRAKEDAGFSGNMNRCLELCAHNIIKPLCDDDLIPPDFLALTVPYVDDNALVMTDIEKFPFGSEPEGVTRPSAAAPGTECRPAGYRPDIWTLPYSFLPSAMLYTRALFESLGGFDPKVVTSDWDFFIEACLHRNVVHIRQVLCYVGVWPGSLTEEMVAQPYFFPLEGLYTRFRVFHCKTLPLTVRSRLLSRQLREWVIQTLRFLKHPFTLHYRRGYIEYTNRFFRLLFAGKKAFTPRPEQRPRFSSGTAR